MPNTAINFGRLLIIIGLFGYAYGFLAGGASITAMIPAAFGIILIALGYIARANENLRKHLMHAALLVALLGFILPLGRILSKLSTFAISAATISMLLMMLVCLAFLVLGVKSFRDARRN
ncbi:MAG: hypothetical protein ACK5NT_11680 [Pyrinomonadaceae bacterium]